MGRWKAPVAGICICLILIVVLLTILFVVMSKHPEFRTEMASTDMRIMDKLSNVWCGWQEISSSHPLTVYRASGEPVVKNGPNNIHRLNFTRKLHFGKESQLQYFFLPGSLLDIRACTDKDGIFLRIFKGLQNWKNCLQLRKTHPFQSEDSSSEESKEDEGYRSHSKGFWKNYEKKTLNKMIGRWYPGECRHFKSLKIPFRTKACDSTSLSFIVNEKDFYVFSVEDYHPSSDESQTNVRLILNRTIYDIHGQFPVCKNSLKCEISLSFGSSDRAVVEVAPEKDAGAISYSVRSSCKPRVFFFIFLFVLIPLTVLLCVGCTVMLCKKSNEDNVIKYIEIIRERMDRTPPKVPLLAGPDVTLYSRSSYNRIPLAPTRSPPPSYSQCSAPPSYTYVTSLQDKNSTGTSAK